MKRNEGMKRTGMRQLSLGLAAILAASVLPWHMRDAQAAQQTLKSPQVTADSAMETGQKVTWDCVWFGSYPQAEVVPSAADYTAIDKDLLQDGDLIEDGSLYRTLQDASGWDKNNEITIGGDKYRRMKQWDATIISDDGEEGYYTWTDSEKWHYFKYEPVKWRVLKADGKQALLLSDIALDDQTYNRWSNTQNKDMTWEVSTVRSWLNGYGPSENRNGIDYSGKSFIGSAFSESERSAIAETTVINADNLEYGTEGGNDTKDKIFFLSATEAWGADAASHGFAPDKKSYNEARRCKSSAYAKAMGARADTVDAYKGNCFWWLRSPGGNSYTAACVSSGGRGDDDGVLVPAGNFGVRAALNLNLSSNQWSYAGTVSSGTTGNGQGGGDSSAGGKPTSQSQISGLLKKADTSKSLSIKKGKTKTIKVKLPKGLKQVTKFSGKNKKGQVKISFKSQNKKVAAVDSKGKIKAKKKGTAKITVTLSAHDGKKTIPRKLTVTVKVK